MKLFLMSLLLLVIWVTPLQAGPCDAFAPYYHQVTNSPGSRIADVFLFAFSAPVAVAVIGGPRRNVVNTRDRRRARVASAGCLPITTAKHFFSSRSPRAEHWIAD